jgi:hypothetical protein
MAEPDGRPPESDDDVWAQIVAGYDQSLDQPFAPWPVAEDLDVEPADPDGDPRDAPGPAGGDSGVGHAADGPRAESDSDAAPEPPWSRRHQDRLAGAEQADEDSSYGDGPYPPDEEPTTGARPDAADRFVPPPPPPLPELDTVSQLAWGGLIGGPLFLVIAAIAGWALPSLLLGLAVLAFVAGFVTLVVRMKDKPPDDWDPGNGAVL